MRPLTDVFRWHAIAICAITCCAIGLATPLTTQSADAGVSDRELAEAAARARVGDSRAIETLARASKQESETGIRDALLFSLATAQASSTPKEAAVTLRRLLEEFPNSPLAARATATLARLEPQEIATAALRTALERLLSSDAPRADVAMISLELGRRETALDPAAAARRLQQARKLGRGNATARSAAELLGDLRASHPELSPVGDEALYLEAKLCASEGDGAGQARALDRLLTIHPTSSLVHDASIQRARLVAATEGRAKAAEWLESRASLAKEKGLRAKLTHAAANQRWNADQDDRAMEGFRAVIALGSSQALAQESRYAIGRIHEARQRFIDAAKEYETAGGGPSEELSAESRWRIGWSAYLAGDFVGARRAFARMVEHYPGKVPRGARESALYWEARSLEKAEGREAANPLYRTVLEAFPDGYYAYLVETRSELRAPRPRPRALTPESSADRDVGAKLERIRRLYAIGYGDIAEIDTSRLIDGATAAHQRDLLPGLAAAGAHRAALAKALALYHRNVISEDQLYFFLYPRAFSDSVERHSRTANVDPFLVFALMKQESMFDRQAVSPASAYGLMQLLLTTARRVDRGAGGRSLEREDLYDPDTNIELGTAYLGDLAARYRNDTVLMLAGYNAGEKAADGWNNRFGALDVDEFVERITYRETREYVKKVLSNRRNYSRLYGDAGSDVGTQRGG